MHDTHLKGYEGIISLVEFKQAEGMESSRTELLELSVLCVYGPAPNTALCC